MRLLEEAELSSSYNPIPWDSFDLEEPPMLQSALAERMRLNELLAAKTYDCKEPVKVGDDTEMYVICKEISQLSVAASISGNDRSTGEVERQLNASKWVLFLPEGNAMIEKLSGDVEVNYLTELEEWQNWHTWDMEQSLKNNRYLTVKFDLYSKHFKSHDQAEVIRKLVKITDAHHLFIAIRVAKEEEEADDLTKWYQLLYWLMLNQGYALIGAFPHGSCGQVIQNCRYHVSLARVGEKNIKTAPVFGLGSPLEEEQRLLQYIRSENKACAVHSNADFPLYCTDSLGIIGNAVVITYSPWSDSFVPAPQKNFKWTVISPIEIRTRFQHIQAGVTGNNETITSGKWTLEPIDKLLSSTEKPIDLLLLDLKGGEWTLLPTLLNFINSNKKSVHQISIRGRIFPEENENYRQFYWNLRSLQRAEFTKTVGACKLSDFDLIYISQK